jgi:hypothetical protein
MAAEQEPTPDGRNGVHDRDQHGGSPDPEGADSQDHQRFERRVFDLLVDVRRAPVRDLIEA